MADLGASSAADPYGLRRFVQAQASAYDQALSEIRDGRKRSHWMWYIFPQYHGLGSSATAKRYAIRSVAEAQAYLRHPVLGPRLLECAEAALAVDGQAASEMFGYPDDLKLRSCATLFACVSPPGSVFARLLDKYFQGERDDRTIQLLDSSTDSARPRWGVAPYFIVDDVVATADYYRDKLGFRHERLWGEPPSFCMVTRGGIVIMLGQLERTGVMRPNRTIDPEGGAWDAYIWVDQADALYAEFRARGVTIARDLCDQPYGCRDFDVEDCNGYRLCFGEDIEGR